MVGRFWDWWRRRRVLVDAFFVAPVALISLFQTGTVSGGGWSGPGNDLLAYALLSTALLAPLLWRRRWPRASFAVIALVSFAQWLLHVEMVPGNIAILYGVYTVTAYCSFRWGLAAALTGVLGGFLEAVQLWDDNWKQLRGFALFITVIVVGVWILGLHMRTRRAYLHSLVERADRLERERDNELQVARASERSRIARELHDVVAHNVSVIVVQADGASFAIETDPARAKQALETISATGRTALAEMRRLLGVLREGGDESDGYTPQPGVAQLAELVEQMHGSGLPVTLRVEGAPVELSEGRQLTIFRVVQEALTNTLKHGGPRAAAQVTVRYERDAIEVRVSDDGRGAAALDDGRGHGLLGMRERVAVYGGQVRAAPRPGGYEVIARIPVREEART